MPSPFLRAGRKIESLAPHPLKSAAAHRIVAAAVLDANALTADVLHLQVFQQTLLHAKHPDADVDVFNRESTKDSTIMQDLDAALVFRAVHDRVA